MYICIKAQLKQYLSPLSSIYMVIIRAKFLTLRPMISIKTYKNTLKTQLQLQLHAVTLHGLTYGLLHQPQSLNNPTDRPALVQRRCHGPPIR